MEETRDFLCCLQNLGIPEDAILVLFDVIGLYPHIPTKCVIIYL